MNIFSNIKLFYLRKIEPGFKVKRKDLVIDIGSGDKPFWRADVFLDKLDLGDNQRTSNSKTIHDIGKFVDSDVIKMPFKDKTFDFSFCSHLLEHVDDPRKVIKEIERISKAGYIEVPNGILESVMPFESHLWFVFKEDNKLVFYRKSKKIHEILTKNGKGFEYLLGKVQEPFIRFYWKNSINFEIIDETINKEKYISPINKAKNTKEGINFYIILVKIIRLIFYKYKKISL